MHFISFKDGKYWKILGKDGSSCRRRYNALLFESAELAKEYAMNYGKNFKVVFWEKFSTKEEWIAKRYLKNLPKGNFSSLRKDLNVTTEHSFS